MGFYSTFVTDAVFSKQQIPSWFVEKYKDRVNIPECDGIFCLSSYREGKEYGYFESLAEDIQKIISVNSKCVLVFLHECNSISRYAITKHTIKCSRPVGYCDDSDECHVCNYGSECDAF